MAAPRPDEQRGLTMLGTLRLLLATAVALSHAGVSFYGFHIGVPAVVVFYVLAGYVVALQWQELRKTRAIQDAIAAFYLDRCLRLWPAYLVALFVCGLIVVAIAPDSPFVSRGADVGCVIANLTIIPLNFFMFTDLDRCSLIPVAWSLGLELQFYLIAPFLMQFARLRTALVGGSIGVYLIATFGWIDTDVWGYRLLPGTLFVFVMGVFLATSNLNRRHVGVGWLIAIAAAATLFTVVASSPHLHRNFAVETTFGIMLAVPMIALARLVPRTRLDDLAGATAYPLFLLHFGVLWVALEVFEDVLQPAALAAYLGTAAALAFAIASALDVPLARFRRLLRRRDQPVVADVPLVFRSK